MGTKQKKQNKNKKGNKKNNSKPETNKPNVKKEEKYINSKSNIGRNGKNDYNNKNQKKKKRKQQSKQDMENFRTQLNSLGLRINEVGGDGNCFFRSVCDQLEGMEANHAYYRSLACEYIEANKDFIKFFIEDDKNIDDYIRDMRKDGIWGGNIEIFSLSMSLNVNFYIFLYNRPLYIVKNHDKPKRNIFLSYHDAEHYNSVRLKEDFAVGEIPPEIPMSLLTGVDQTQDSNALKDSESQNNSDDEDQENTNKENNKEDDDDISDGEDEEDSDNNENNENQESNELDNNSNNENNDMENIRSNNNGNKDNKEKKKAKKDKDKKSEINNEPKKEEVEFTISFKGITIKDKYINNHNLNNNNHTNQNSKNKSEKSKKTPILVEKLLNINGLIYEEVKKKKQIKNDSMKVYEEDKDIKGDYEIDSNNFYCDISEFYEKFSEELAKDSEEKLFSTSKNNNNKANDKESKDIDSITKKIELIYI